MGSGKGNNKRIKTSAINNEKTLVEVISEIARDYPELLSKSGFLIVDTDAWLNELNNKKINTKQTFSEYYLGYNKNFEDMSLGEFDLILNNCLQEMLRGGYVAPFMPIPISPADMKKYFNNLNFDKYIITSIREENMLNISLVNLDGDFKLNTIKHNFNEHENEYITSKSLDYDYDFLESSPIDVINTLLDNINKAYVNKHKIKK